MTPEQLAALVSERDALKAELARAMAEIESLDAECDSRHERFLAAEAEVARLSTPPDDAEVAEMVMDLMHTGEMSMLYRCEIANALMRLSHALASETAKREAMEAALRQYAYAFCEGFCDDMPTMEYTDADCERDCGGCKARATLAKHGSK